jgi:hypothetical protein
MRGVRMRLKLASIAFVSGVSFTLPSLAATVESIEGTVSINRGEGYHQITAPTQIKAGEFVMAGPGGSAEVVYYDGCSVKVQPGAVVTIAREPPCAAGSMMRLGAGSLKDTPSDFIVEERPDFGRKKLLVAGLVVGGIIAAVLLLRDDDDREEAISP